MVRTDAFALALGGLQCPHCFFDTDNGSERLIVLEGRELPDNAGWLGDLAGHGPRQDGSV